MASILKALEGADKIGIKTGVSGSKARLQLGFVLISMARIATKGYMDAMGIGCHLGPCKCLRAVLLPGPYRSE